MQIAVVVSMEAGVERAYAINSVNMAQGFAKLGYNVTLITFAHREGKRDFESLAKQYDIRVSLRWIQVPRVFRKNLIRPDEPFAWMAMFHLLRLQPSLVFSRSYIAPTVSAKFGFLTVAESHAHTDNRTPPFLKMIKSSQQYKQFKGLVTISEVLSQQYQSLGVPKDKLWVLPTGVDINRFRRPPQLLASPYKTSAPNVVYVGHLYDYKGIPTILETAVLCPNINFHLVGGLPQDIEHVQRTMTEENLDNVILHGMKPQSEIPAYLHHADILLLPPSLNHPSARWTSPVKLGEYLASGTPVIASRIPALEDWLSDEEVTFVKPDSGVAMQKGIQEILATPDLAKARAEKGLKLANTLSYQNRAKAILERCGF